MRAWLRHHVRCVLKAIGGIVREPVSMLLNVLVIGAALALPLAGYLALDALKRLSGGVATDPQLAVFLALDASRADIERIEAELKSAAFAQRVEFVSKDQALADLRREEAMAETIRALKSNPLPDAFVVHLRPDAGGAAEVFAQRLRAVPKVAHVRLDADWLRRIDAILRLVRYATLVLAGLLAAALVAVTFNTIRMQIARDLPAVELSRLLGATDGYLRRPFLYIGGWLGLLGGLVATAVISLLIALLNRPVAELAETY